MHMVHSEVVKSSWEHAGHTHISYSTVSTVVSRVSTHGHLNITRNFGPHGRLPGIKIPYICIEAATVAP